MNSIYICSVLMALAIFSGCMYLLSVTSFKKSIRGRLDDVIHTELSWRRMGESNERFDKSYAKKTEVKKQNLSGIIWIIAVGLIAWGWEYSAPGGMWNKLITVWAVSVVLRRVVALMRVRKYRTQIEEQLPTALDLLVVCVEAGMSIHTALIRVAEEMKGTPLSYELKLTFQKLNANVPLEQAFRELGDRTKVHDVQSLASTVIQSEKLGMSLAETLRNQSKVLRETIRLRTREKILKVPVKLIIPLVLCILPAVFTVLLGPAFIQIAKGLSTGPK